MTTEVEPHMEVGETNYVSASSNVLIEKGDDEDTDYLDNENNSLYDGDSEGDSDGVENNEKHGMQGMGDVISKILNKKIQTNKSNSVVLSKSKTETKRKTNVKEELAAKKAKVELVKEQREANHVQPLEKNDAIKEAILKRIATKGVVMLFNAVSAHQKAKAEKLKNAKTEGEKVKAEKSMKKSTFMDMLKKDKSKGLKEVTHDENKPEATWNVLKNDFMLGSSLKHWDKDDNEGKSIKKKKNIEETLDVESSDDDNNDSEESS